MAMASQQQQHRYQDFALAFPAATAATAAATARGERRDFMSQADKLPSRQTMTTAGSSRFSNDGSNNNINSSNLQHHPSASAAGVNNNKSNADDRQRRADENAAFVKMLEEESFVLQGGRLPSTSNNANNDTNRNSNKTSGRTIRQSRNTGMDAHGPNRDDFRRGLYEEQQNISHGSALSGRSSGRSSARRGSLASHAEHQQQQPIYAPYQQYTSGDDRRHHHQQQQQQQRDIPLEFSGDDRHRQYPPQHPPQHQQQQHPHQHDIPLELDIPTSSRDRLGVEDRNSGHNNHKPSFVPPANPLLEEEQQEYDLNMNVDEMRKSNSSEDRRHPSQLRLLTRQAKERTLTNDPPPDPHTSRGEDLTPPPPRSNANHGMSLEQAIHNLELESGQQQSLEPQRQYRQRSLPDDYDAILGGENSRRSQYDHHHRGNDDRQYHHYSQQQQQQQQQHQQDIVLDRYHSRDRHHPPPQPPRQAYDNAPQRLVAPIEVLEFPTNWDGREIEPTEDEEMMDREEDEYYRRRNAHRQPQPQSQSSHLTQQSHSQSQRSSTQQRKTIRRVMSCDSRQSDAFGSSNNNSNFASDLYSQNLAVSGRRIAPMQIEVSPGVSMPFRGSEETWEAIALNRIAQTECLGCSIQLYCVEDAELVVCPDCQTMSPAHQLGNGEDPKRNRRSGLGLGFKEEQLVQWRHG